MNRTILSLFTIILVFTFILLNGICRAEEKAATQGEPDTSSYLIGANDVLNIFIWNEADLTRDVTVMADGRITFPLVGEVMAKGHSVTELKNVITEKLKNFISNPEVTVIVRESKSRKIFTIGNITRPASYDLDADMTVLQALSAAGGFTEWADKKNIIIVRREKGKEKIYHFNYQEVIAGKALDQNIILEPGDTIVVP